MFEDATFESAGRIPTRSHGWMIAAFGVNGSILLALILIPLIYPEALPLRGLTILVTAPVPPPQGVPAQQPVRATHSSSETLMIPVLAPPRIRTEIASNAGPEPDGSINPVELGPGTGIPGGTGIPFPNQSAPPAVQPAAHPNHAVRLPGSFVEGLLVEKNLPRYPSIAIASRTEGTVVLQATVSRAGTVENLRVVSGPAMLRQAALDAVKTWRYKPYLLDGQPVEVETTVKVIFTLTR